MLRSYEDLPSVDHFTLRQYSWHVMAPSSAKSNSDGGKRGRLPPRRRRKPPDRLILPQEAETFEVHPSDAGMRLDRFLKGKLKWRSRAKVQELIREREITADGVRLDRAYRVKTGDEIRIPVPPPPEDAFRILSEISLDILYEDEVLVVLNKQPNIVVHPVGPHRYNTLINALHLRYRDLDDEERDVVPKLAHRIDRETSGVLVVSKSGRHDRGAPIVFENTEVRKEYLALAEGALASNTGTIDLPIGPEPGVDVRVVKRVITPDGASARTDYTVEERFEAFTLVRLRLHTGRQHQIRVHLQALGHAVVCDKSYGVRKVLRLSDVRSLSVGEEDMILLERQALHSYRVAFPHPVTGEELTVEAPLPEDMRRAREVMRSMVPGDDRP